MTELAPKPLPRPRITVQQVQAVVARYHGMTVPQLLERTRRAAIARPRQVAMFLAAKFTSASMPEMGRRFGGFDHSTVMYGRDQIKQRMKIDAKLARQVADLERILGADQ